MWSYLALRRARFVCSRLGLSAGIQLEGHHLARTDDVDTILMVRAAAGDLAAFENLVRRNQAAAWALAWRVLRDATEAEDVVQEAFLRIYKAASRYEPTARFRTYLYSVITRLCLDRAEKKGSSPKSVMTV